MNNINWQDATKSKPSKKQTPIISKRILVWVYIAHVTPLCTFARYHYVDDIWVIEGLIGNYTPTHFAEINKPINY